VGGVVTISAVDVTTVMRTTCSTTTDVETVGDRADHPTVTGEAVAVAGLGPGPGPEMAIEDDGMTMTETVTEIGTTGARKIEGVPPETDVAPAL